MKSFPDVGPLEWAGSPQMENHREGHTERGTQDPHLHTGVKAPDVPIHGNRKKWRGDLVKRQEMEVSM